MALRTTRRGECWQRDPSAFHLVLSWVPASVVLPSTSRGLHPACLLLRRIPFSAILFSLDF